MPFLSNNPLLGGDEGKIVKRPNKRGKGREPASQAKRWAAIAVAGFIFVLLLLFSFLAGYLLARDAAPTPIIIEKAAN